MKIKVSPATGAQLKSLRESKGIQAKFVALAMGIVAPHLCDLEHDRRRWNDAKISAYLKAIGK